MRLSLYLASAALIAASPASAVVVVNTLPYLNTPDWTDTQFDGTLETNGAGESVLHTAYGGNWFGWGAGYADPAPSWSIDNNANGNLVSFTARYSDPARDWEAYMGDGNYLASMTFNPTDCDGNAQDCRMYNPYHRAIDLYFSDGAAIPNVIRRRISFDITTNHTYGFVLKNGLVEYRIDNERYAGHALTSGANILVIGDGSGSTQTGFGDMIVSAASVENAPDYDIVLAGGVPEPASWSFMLTGLGLLGAAHRRRRVAVTA